MNTPKNCLMLLEPVQGGIRERDIVDPEQVDAGGVHAPEFEIGVLSNGVAGFREVDHLL